MDTRRTWLKGGEMLIVIVLKWKFWVYSVVLDPDHLEQRVFSVGRINLEDVLNLTD